MPNVYLVVGTDYEEHTVLGAYLDKDKAEARYELERKSVADRREKYKNDRSDFENYVSVSYSIELEEYEIID